MWGGSWPLAATWEPRDSGEVEEVASARVTGMAGVGVGASSMVPFLVESGGIHGVIPAGDSGSGRKTRTSVVAVWRVRCLGAAGGEHQLGSATCGSGFISQMPTHLILSVSPEIGRISRLSVGVSLTLSQSHFPSP